MPTDHPTEVPTDDEWHYMDCGIAGGFPHRASDHVTPSPTPEASAESAVREGLRVHDGIINVSGSGDPLNDLVVLRVENVNGLLTALTEEREAHQRTQYQLDGYMQIVATGTEQLADAEATLEARNREVERLRAVLIEIESMNHTWGYNSAEAAADALAPPTPQTPKEDGE